MLPEFIIEELKRREQKHELFEEIRIECPIVEGLDEPYTNVSEVLPKSDRGVAVIDFTI
jgi:hypothetical protein